MWKKNDPPPSEPHSPTPTPERRNPNPTPGQPVATIGPSISIEGNLSGDEALRIEGKVEGEIRVPHQTLTIGRTGRVKANIYGKSIHIEGEVHGDIFGEEEIHLRSSGQVEGNLQAPRVQLENGARFRGNIDMEPRPAAGGKPGVVRQGENRPGEVKSAPDRPGQKPAGARI